MRPARSNGARQTIVRIAAAAGALAGLWLVAPPGAAAQGCTPAMAFVRDVTVPDDTAFRPGEPFSKTWELRNAGDCDWAAGYRVAFLDGDPLGAGLTQAIAAVPAGETVAATVPMTAPAAAGAYTSRWRLLDPSGRAVGDAFYARIVVRDATPPAASPAAAPAEDDFFSDFSSPDDGIRDFSDRFRAVYHADGRLHVESRKGPVDSGEMKQFWGAGQAIEREYRDFTLEVDAGRISGEGFGGGAAVVMFGYHDDRNYHYLEVQRVGQRWMIAKAIDGRATNVLPGGPMDRWDIGPAIHGADVTTGEAWDRVRIVVEGRPEGTRIALWSNGSFLGEALDPDYRGGLIVLAVFTYGNEAHAAYDNLSIRGSRVR